MFTINNLRKQIRYFFLQVKRFFYLLTHTDPEKIAIKPIKFGLIILGSFLTIFLIWGVLAPIDSASIASGKVVLDFNKKTIQHLEGGIIEEILVKEGQKVVTNQPLIYLNDIQSRSQNEMFKKQLITSIAMKIRLLAQRDNLLQADFSPILAEFKENNEFDQEIEQIILTQQNLFKTNQDTKQSKIDILNKRIDQFKEEIGGIEAQKKATNQELKVLYQQQEMLQKLVKNNNYPLNKFLEIKKQIATSEGKKGELEALSAKVKQSISETELEIINLENENLKEILAQVQEIEVKISDLTEQLISVKDVLKRTIIKSPNSGTVTDLKYHTVGAVIAPAAEIMYIVPDDDELIIEAQINPQDINNVKAGLNAKIQLTAFKGRKMPKLDGKVLSVSADLLLDEISRQHYFLARIKIDEKEIKKLKSGVNLYPGMPAQVFVVTGSRSFFKYLFDPITDSAYKAFREE